MGLFSGLSNIGLDAFKDKKVYEEASEKTEGKQGQTEPAVMTEEDFLFEKKYTCPACDAQFKALTVRAGKARMIGQDEDLRPHYEGIDPIKYDAILCNHCGFAAISKGFHNMTSLQRKQIREQVSANFKPLEEEPKILSYDDAILRHKIALLCATVKNGKQSERAYTCLKLGWLIRTRMEEMDPQGEEYEALGETLKECYENALEGFNHAISKENFPMMGMEEMTVIYLMAVLAMRIEQYDEALRLIGRVITSHNVGPRLKEKALTLKDKIRAESSRQI